MAAGRGLGRGEQPPPAGAVDVDVSRVRAVLVLGGVPWGELDDGVQEVRLKLLEQQADPGRPGIRNPSAWSGVVAARVAVDRHRAGAREDGLRARLAARWARPEAVRPLDEDRTLALTVAEALARLTPEQRHLLVLRFYVDLPVAAIARELGVPEGTVKSRLHTATARMRALLSETEGDSGDRTG
ncbi:sigma-70 family RNA polymerase sigma factor [Streptomyces sp. NPDC047046]|uniref:RNA polymerase sigma factor n=1 Tax=unclassified Streptomyces TaxID=2593676 RepID=UPI0033ED0CDE